MNNIKYEISAYQKAWIFVLEKKYTIEGKSYKEILDKLEDILHNKNVINGIKKL